MSGKATLLVVDDDPNLRKTLADILRLKGYDIVTAATGADAVAVARARPVSLALIDLRLPDMPGMEVMERIKADAPDAEAIILTGHASLETAIEATRKGAYSYILKPYQMDELLLSIGRGVERQQTRAEVLRLSEALKQSREAIVVADGGLHFQYVNPAFTELLGYSLEEVAGRPLDMIAPADGGMPPRETARVAGEAGAFHGEVLRRAKDGTLVPFMLNVTPVQGPGGRVASYVGIMTDLTEMHRMEASLRESEEKFRSISAAAHDAIVMLDASGCVCYWNAAAEQMFGYASAEMLGRDLHAMLAPARYSEAFREGFARFALTGQGHAVGRTLELAALRRSGEEFPMEISLSAVRQGDHSLAIGIVRDISERKRAEAQTQSYLDELTRINSELQQLNEELVQAQTQLVQSEKMASIGLLAAGVAHEINNPIGYVQSNLGSLDGYIDGFLSLCDAYERAEAAMAPDGRELAEIRALKDKLDLPYLKADVKALTRESHQGIERVRRIIQDLKCFSHADASEEWKEQDLHQGLETTLNVVWNELKYRCEVKKEYGDLPRVECLLSQLNQVFMNLLVNAAQAIPDRGTVTLRTGTADDQVWVEVADTGSGIAPENLQRIFDPFFTTKPVGKGTGLGLSVSYNIIQKHHGRIDVTSSPGQGTTFRIWLPVRQPPA